MTRHISLMAAEQRIQRERKNTTDNCYSMVLFARLIRNLITFRVPKEKGK